MVTPPPLVEAALKDHLKEARNKGSGHNLPGIDFIYIINLDFRPEKFQASCKQFNPYGIYPYRFSAVVGKELLPSVALDVSLKFENYMLQVSASECRNEEAMFFPASALDPKRRYVGRQITKGFLGSFLSHLSVVYDALKSGYKTVWILEDDVEALDNPRKISSFIEELDRVVPKWDVLFTNPGMRGTENINKFTQDSQRPDMPENDPTTFAYRRRSIDDVFMWDGPRWGTHSYVVRRSGMKKIIKYFNKRGFFMPYDVEFMYMPLKIISLKKHFVTDASGVISDNWDKS
jgi:GR25 family glycosyltransferase involved in LPS biosynthesis